MANPQLPGSVNLFKSKLFVIIKEGNENGLFISQCVYVMTHTQKGKRLFSAAFFTLK